MRNSAIGSMFLPNPLFWFAGWVLLVCLYMISFRYSLFEHLWAYIVYILQLMLDVSIGLYCYLSFKTKSDQVTKKYYLFILLSIIPGLFANEIYNVLINIFRLNRYGNNSLYWTVAYTIFLFIQIYGWSYLFANKIKNYKYSHKWFTLYPFLFSGIIIFLWLIFIVIINNRAYQKINFDGLINSFLEIISFTLMSMNLSRTKNSSLIYIEMGFLLLVGLNFAHRFSDVLSIYYKAFDIVWFSCLIVITYGLYAAFKEGNNKIQFYEENSIHVLTSGAFVLFANFILTIFTITSFGLSILQIDKIPNFKLFMLDIPSAFIFTYSLTLLLAKFLALRLSFPLDEIVKRINKIAENINVNENDRIDQFTISEVDALEKFIMKTISELRYANDVKSQFLMNMSHDFRTPASGILYMSRLIHDRMIDDENKKLQKMIVNSSEQLMMFLEDVLDYSRLDNNKLKIDLRSFDMIELIDELIAFTSTKIHERGLTLTASFFQKKVIYTSDRVIIQRILLNILSNAIKFTHQGYIQIKILVNVIENKDWLIIKVKDSGIGIEKANQQKIFEPFYRVESAELSKYPGIGLGLSNVDLILKKLNGKITLESEVSVGSEFTVYLPF